MDYRYVQYGCGLNAPQRWLNFDNSPTLVLQRIPFIGKLFKRGRYPIFPSNVRYGDIVRGLSVSPNSCKAIYCSHVLEHLSLQDLRIALDHTYDYLEVGGVFRMVLPDLEYLARTYLNSEATDASLKFMESSGLGKKTRPRNITNFLRTWLGGSHHLWMWDYKSLKKELEDVGFKDIRKAKFNDSELSEFSDTEEEERWSSACLGIQCRK